jgi:hypothetical protein
MCISGHIHDYQRVQDNMYYVGTPIQHGTTDIGEKTVSSFTFSKTEERWLTEEKRIDLNIPKKIHITVTREQLLAFAVPSNASYVRLDIEIDPIEFKSLLKDKHVKKLKEAGVHIKPIDIRKRIEKSEVNRKDFKICYARRLNTMIKNEDESVQKVFVELFGPLASTKKKIRFRIKDVSSS